ncbi:unnamed protein product [Lepidochelys kempii]
MEPGEPVLAGGTGANQPSPTPACDSARRVVSECLSYLGPCAKSMAVPGLCPARQSWAEPAPGPERVTVVCCPGAMEWAGICADAPASPGSWISAWIGLTAASEQGLHRSPPWCSALVLVPPAMGYGTPTGKREGLNQDHTRPGQLGVPRPTQERRGGGSAHGAQVCQEQPACPSERANDTGSSLGVLRSAVGWAWTC